MTNNQNEKFKVWWDEKESIIRTKYWGDAEEEDAIKQTAAISELAQSKVGKVDVLNDLSEAGKASSKARKLYAEQIKKEKIRKHAFIGAKVMTRVIVSFIQKFSGATNVKFFTTEEEALKWLKEE